jgi:hypothetical protein
MTPFCKSTAMGLVRSIYYPLSSTTKILKLISVTMQSSRILHYTCSIPWSSLDSTVMTFSVWDNLEIFQYSRWQQEFSTLDQIFHCNHNL